VPRDAATILEEAIATYTQRRAVYGNNGPKLGHAMAAMFPDGITLHTPKDFERFYLYMMQVVKLSRYCNNFSDGGHKDSATDNIVYAALLQAADEDPT
jgi:hypothetical protein